VKTIPGNPVHTFLKTKPRTFWLVKTHTGKSQCEWDVLDYEPQLNDLSTEAIKVIEMYSKKMTHNPT